MCRKCAVYTVNVEFHDDVLSFDFDTIAEAIDFASDVQRNGRSGFIGKRGHTEAARFEADAQPLTGVLHFRVETVFGKFIGYADVPVPAFDVGLDECDLRYEYGGRALRFSGALEQGDFCNVDFIGYSVQRG